MECVTFCAVKHEVKCLIYNSAKKTKTKKKPSLLLSGLTSRKKRKHQLYNILVAKRTRQRDHAIID